MNTGNENGNRKTTPRTLRIATLSNALLWILSIIALIFIMQNNSSPKGLFVILAAGLATAVAVISAEQSQS